jgi:hypothetical protein
LLTILFDSVADMPGCLSYIIAKDPADQHALWITEVWDSQTSHQASLIPPCYTAGDSSGSAADRRLWRAHDHRASRR